MNSLDHHCFTILRQADFDRYIAILFAPASKRAGLATIWAFNYEMAKIIERVKEPLIAEMRLRWWCDEIEAMSACHIKREVESHEGKNPLLSALGITIDQFNLSKQCFIACCEARIDLLYGERGRNFADGEEFESYGQATSGTLFQLSCRILAPDQTVRIQQACFYAGQVDTLWRHWRWHALQGDERQQDDQILDRLKDYYDCFLKEMQNVPRACRPAFLSLVPIGFALRSRYYANVDKRSSLRRLMLMSRAALTGRFK